MITLIHIVIALASIAYLTALMIRPQKRSFKVSVISVAATLASGILLVVINPSAMLHVCMSGTVYMIVALAALAFARHQKVKYFTAG